MKLNKLHLGCGRTRMNGWINCDFLPSSTVDVMFDVTKEWPFRDNTASEIYSSHMLEHIVDFRSFFKEAWRVMHPISGMMLRMPYGSHKLALADPTHIRPWYPESFCFLQPGYSESTNNPQHNWKWPFSIETVQLRLPVKLLPIVNRKWKRRLLAKPYIGELFDHLIQELWVHLKPVKSEQDADYFKKTRESWVVPFQYVMYKHNWEGRELKKGEPADFVSLMDGFRLGDME